MLKLTYTEVGLHMEHIAALLETFVAQRVILALRTGQTLHIEPGKASFLVPADAPGLSHLEITLRLKHSQDITITHVDEEFVEMSLHGIWVAHSAEAHEGMFITTLCDFHSETLRERAEFFVHKLWQSTQTEVSSLA